MLIDRWRAAPDLVWTHYDDSDDWVVFNPRSGDVHLFTAPAHLLWQLVDRGVASPEPLIAALASQTGRAADEPLTTAVRETLAFMDRAGLIAPVVQ